MYSKAGGIPFGVGDRLEVGLRIGLLVIAGDDLAARTLPRQLRLDDLGPAVEQVVLVVGDPSVVIGDAGQVAGQVVAHRHHVAQAIGGGIAAVQFVVVVGGGDPLPVGFAGQVAVFVVGEGFLAEVVAGGAVAGDLLHLVAGRVLVLQGQAGPVGFAEEVALGVVAGGLDLARPRRQGVAGQVGVGDRCRMVEVVVGEDRPVAVGVGLGDLAAADVVVEIGDASFGTGDGVGIAVAVVGVGRDVLPRVGNRLYFAGREVGVVGAHGDPRPHAS